MRICKKIFRILGVIVLFIVVVLILWWFWPPRTPSIKSENGNSIASIDYIEIGGIEQCLLTRGQDIRNPIILFLHGGPGMPMMYLAHEFQRNLENDFTVVQWDRRGAGKTYFRNIPSAKSMNVRQMIDDTYEVIDSLKERFNQDKIILIGHSFGTHLGSIMVDERPELFSAYISIGQVVDNDKSLKLQEAFIREKANQNNRADIISELDKQEKPNYETWLFEFGGEIKNSTSFFPLIWSGIFAPEYTLPEVLKVAEASSFSSSKMKYNVLSGSIYNNIQDYPVPVYFIVGKSDYTTPHELITEYYDMIKAPKKDIIYFDNSAHFPFFEEPEKFCTVIKDLILKEN